MYMKKICVRINMYAYGYVSEYDVCMCIHTYASGYMHA